MRIVAISDTHNRHKKLTIPECDLLIHAGDWSGKGAKSEVEDFAKWMAKQTQCKNIVVIPGNHELYLEQGLPTSRAWFTDHCPNAHLLIDEAVTIEGIKIYGSPATPFFCDWAWNRAPGAKRAECHIAYGQIKYANPIVPHWNAIPDDVNILITHGPPYGILDTTTYADGSPRNEPLGCSDLMKRIKELKDLDLHFFGHIHHPGGTQLHRDGVSFYNAAICDETYYPSNPLTILDYTK